MRFLLITFIEKEFVSFILVWFGFIVLIDTFNNISVISWRSVLLVEITR